MACLRKLQRWNLTSIFEEYRRFTKHKVKYTYVFVKQIYGVDMIPFTSTLNYTKYLVKTALGGMRLTGAHRTALVRILECFTWSTNVFGGDAILVNCVRYV